MSLLLATGAFAQPQVTMEYESQFGQFGFYLPSSPPNQNPPTGFNGPTGVAFLTGERLVVADRGNRKLQSCSLEGECSWFGLDSSMGFRNQVGTFDLPHGVAVDPEMRIAVADEDNHALQLCDIAGECKYSGDQLTFDNKCSTSLGRWCLPQDVAYNAGGEVLGLDTGNSRIQVLRPSDLNVLRSYQVSEGSGPGQTSNPRGLSVDPEGRIIIADTGNHRIQVCVRPQSRNALECSVFGGMGSGAGKFSSPVGVEADRLGRIWVADTGNNRIQVCDRLGACRVFGGPGTGPFEFDAPSDVAVHPSGRVAVVDTNNSRIQLFTTEAAFSINAGMSDAWFNALTNGQGFLISAWPQLGQVFMAQFTFDTERPGPEVAAIVGGPGQRWVTALGPYDGATAVLSAELTRGGVLDSASPAPVQTQGYGTYTLVFSDCSHGTIVYDFPDLDLHGEIPIQRIVPDNAALCESLQSP